MNITTLNQYQMIAAYLLDKHFGLTLKDTVLDDQHVVLMLVHHQVSVLEVINQLVEKYQLNRIDRTMYTTQSPLLTQHNLFIALLDFYTR